MLPTLEDLVWTPLDRPTAEALLARLVYPSSAPEPGQFNEIGIAGELAALPVYSRLKLLRLSVLINTDEPDSEPLYSLWDGEERLFHLNGKLHTHRDRLGKLADVLIAKQELTGDEVRALLP